MNYGEELVYWYLRLNGFFPLQNFVIHRTQEVPHSSDIDLIAIRLPFVYEEVGGQITDWDEQLFSIFQPDLPIGVICEVKTGSDIEKEKLFRTQLINYASGRFGFDPNYQCLGNELSKTDLVVKEKYQVAKLLFTSQKQFREDGTFRHISLSHVKEFIELRIRNYKYKKFQDRIFFKSNLIQLMMDENKN